MQGGVHCEILNNREKLKLSQTTRFSIKIHGMLCMLKLSISNSYQEGLIELHQNLDMVLIVVQSF